MESDLEMFVGAGPEVSKAAKFAREAHESVRQEDKAGAQYFDHPRRVALKLGDDVDKAVALLHDVLEDTPVTESQLRAEFGSEIVEAVVALSKTKHDRDPFEDYYARVRSNPHALRVKLADIHDNLEPWRLARLPEVRQKHFLRKYGHALIALAE